MEIAMADTENVHSASAHQNERRDAAPPSDPCSSATGPPLLLGASPADVPFTGW